VVDIKRILGKNGGPRRRRGHKGSLIPKKYISDEKVSRELFS
jgi:hypothetical protein